MSSDLSDTDKNLYREELNTVFTEISQFQKTLQDGAHLQQKAHKSQTSAEKRVINIKLLEKKEHQIKKSVLMTIKG